VSVFASGKQPPGRYRDPPRGVEEPGVHRGPGTGKSRAAQRYGLIPELAAYCKSIDL